MVEVTRFRKVQVRLEIKPVAQPFHPGDLYRRIRIQTEVLTDILIIARSGFCIPQRIGRTDLTWIFFQVAFFIPVDHTYRSQGKGRIYTGFDAGIVTAGITSIDPDIQPVGYIRIDLTEDRDAIVIISLDHMVAFFISRR